ncbi:MAG TPA: alanine racemase [Candidatus Eremiobacteraceae bacterium]|nr:alanine racemase [Candidatus Eremiobacteraceae bacterium]
MRPWLEISPRALAANARAISLRAAPASLCAVVKSNAYGHGLIPTARSLSEAGIPHLSFGVFTPHEAISLRDAGVSEPVLLLGPVADADLEPLVREGVEIALLDASDVGRIGRVRATVHLKIETGTHRFGLQWDQVSAVAAELRDAGARIVGVYSHLADSEELDAAFAREQLARLLDSVEIVGLASGSRPQRHIAASAAAILWPEFRLDMVRGGIALYGLWPSEGVRERMRESDPSFVLEPALRWFAPVVHICDAAAGETVGYGCEFKCARASRIAVLSLGYADGLPRAAGNERGRVRFGKSYAPIVGRICMNACMVDITDLEPPVRRGDAAELDVEEIAAAAGTIAYEILARLPSEMERRYT